VVFVEVPVFRYLTEVFVTKQLILHDSDYMYLWCLYFRY